MNANHIGNCKTGTETLTHILQQQPVLLKSNALIFPHIAKPHLSEIWNNWPKLPGEYAGLCLCA